MLLPALGLLLATAQPVALEVDLTDAPRRLFHANLSIPAHAGAMTLLYPKWLPGEHAPDGPITDLTGLVIEGGGKRIPWQRDPLDMYRFHLVVPSGVARLEVSLDFIQPPAGTTGFSEGASTTHELAVLEWNQVLLYPEQPDALATPFHASVRLPTGWKLATALPPESHSDSEWVFGTVSLETLIDSPAIAGAHFAEYPLGSAGGAPHFLDVVADSDEATELSPDRRAQLEKLTAEANALWGARHYSSYRFLAANADDIAHFGLEHHQSSDDRSGERTFLDDEDWNTRCTLYPHEFTHSWCGKYRRPAGEVVREYQSQQRTDLVWVYEGLTEHLGMVLTARSGLWTPEQFRDHLAAEIVALQEIKGRSWRPLVDTAVDAQNLYHARDDWRRMRRDVDFYEEGDLLWMEVDMRIRKKSGGTKSLDDFCRIFAGGKSGPPEVKGYDEAEVAKDLGKVVPDDWRGLLDKRLTATGDALPLDGLEASGWRIAWNDSESGIQLDWEKSRDRLDLLPSLGLELDTEEESILDVLPGSPADKAGLAPAVKILGFDGRAFDTDWIRSVVKNGTTRKTPIQVVVRDGDAVRVFEIDYKGGARYPHLERIPGTEDLLSRMIAPLTAPASPPAPAPRR